MIDISIIIPAYNEEASLGAILDCIARQEFDPRRIEVVVADNNSTDGTQEMLARYQARSGMRMKVVRETKPHVNAARNAGARAAEGRTLVFLDADNLIPSDFVAQIDELALQRGFRAGTTMTLAMGGSLTGHLVFLVMELCKVLLGRPFGKGFCSRETFEAVGGFDEDVSLGTNLDFLTRVKRHLNTQGEKLVHVPKPVYVSLRRFEKDGYCNVLSRWLLAYAGFRHVPYPRFMKEGQ